MPYPRSDAIWRFATGKAADQNYHGSQTSSAGFGDTLLVCKLAGRTACVERLRGLDVNDLLHNTIGSWLHGSTSQSRFRGLRNVLGWSAVFSIGQGSGTPVPPTSRSITRLYLGTSDLSFTYLAARRPYYSVPWHDAGAPSRLQLIVGRRGIQSVSLVLWSFSK